MKKRTFTIITIIIITIVIAITSPLIINKYFTMDNDEITAELADEFTRTKWFIIDWYNELKETGKYEVYLNEIRFQNGKYTLTVAQNKIRAVYPKGERYFKLEFIKQIEFFEVGGVLRCRLFYGSRGEYLIRIN